MKRRVEFEVLRGLTMRDVQATEDCIMFICDDGRQFSLEHEQDCCETVYLEDVTGELSDLIGHPFLMAEEAESDKQEQLSEYDDSFTWTFYKLATIKGYVTLRWYGTSNGYYSEDVSLYLLNPPTD